MRNVVFSVERRVKTPEGFNDKIRRKNYERPIEEIFDIIGVRIITYFEEGVDYVAQELRQNLFVDEASSYDNANELDVTSFGRRSVHIVRSIPGYEETKPAEMFSESGRFEIQVRSILQHA